MNWKLACILSAVGIAGVALLVPTIGLVQPASTTVSNKAQFVRGTVVASVITRQESFKDIALPHARVFLFKSTDPAKPVASALSDLSGRFIIKTYASGTFKLCVEAERFKPTCSPKTFNLVPPAFSYGIFRIPAPIDSDREANAYGTITLQDGRLARGFEPYHGINSFPRIKLKTASGIIYEGFVNNFGEYIVPRIPTKEDFTLLVSVDKQEMQWPVKAISNLMPRRAHLINMVLPNTGPRIRSVTAIQGNKPVQIAAPGATITINAVAEDPNSDKLQYRWLLPDGKLIGPNDEPSLQWTAPNQSGRYALTVVVSDDRGGHVRGAISVRVGTGGVPFSGMVVDIAGKPISGAQVDINGRLINTNASGWFNYTVPVDAKYVLTIRKAGVEAPNQPGYGTASFVYTAAVTGGRWVLRRAEVASVDPTMPIVLQQKRSELDCVGMTASKINWTPYLQGGLFQWQDGRGNVRALPDVGAKDPKAVENVLRLIARINQSLVAPLSSATKVTTRTQNVSVPCTPGIKIEIPANALINSSTNAPPTGKVQVALSTVSLTASNQMPGDYTAEDTSGKNYGMQSFGAGSVEIGAGAARYNLKPGASATVTIPVDGTQLAGGASLPNKIPFLYYDEKKGVWQADGEAELTGSGTAAAYVKKVSHFSTMNADILKQGESCVAVEVDTSVMTLPFDVEVVMQPSKPNPGVIQVRTLTVSDPNNVIYNLPNDSNIVLTPIIDGVLPDGSSGKVPAGVFVVNTGGPQTSLAKPPTPNADGTYYAEDTNSQPTGPCASRVRLTKLTPVSIPYPGLVEYLQGLYFESTNINEFTNTGVAAAIDQGSQDYYNQADPLKLRDTFNKFKQKNKFGAPLAAGEIETDVQYANSGDLGFGRNMHCRRNAADDGQFDYACYVTNYGQPPANNPDQQDADDVVNPTVTPDATVAMEYSRVELSDPSSFPDNTRAVKFYVYNTNTPDTAPPLRKADLDGHGARPVPQLCMICHGGTAASEAADPANPTGPQKGSFQNRNDILSMQSNFLPFDLHFYKLPTGQSKADPTIQGKFRSLNVDIVRGVDAANGAAGSAIVDVIDNALYQGNSTTQFDDKVVAGWDTGNSNSPPNRFYRDVFARACRTCHTARPFGAPSFNNKADFESVITTVQSLVCNKKVMPHAQRTNDLFWQSLNPNMPAYLQLYGQTLLGWSPADADQCGQFFQPGGTAPSVFASQIYPILTNNCTPCHTNVGYANYSVGLGVAATYNLLTTAIAKDGSSKYIVPNNTTASKLYQRITTGGPGVRMPKNGVDLVTTDTDTPPDGIPDATEIYTWINGGASGP